MQRQRVESGHYFAPRSRTPTEEYCVNKIHIYTQVRKHEDINNTLAIHNLKPKCQKGYFAKGESIFLIVSENLRFCSFIIRLKSFCVTFFFPDVNVPAIFPALYLTPRYTTILRQECQCPCLRDQKSVI